jgi:hypothetical protein
VISHGLVLLPYPLPEIIGTRSVSDFGFGESFLDFGIFACT